VQVVGRAEGVGNAVAQPGRRLAVAEHQRVDPETGVEQPADLARVRGIEQLPVDARGNDCPKDAGDASGEQQGGAAHD